MWTFILAILLFNLIFICLLFFIRHIIAVTTPVLVLIALVAFCCTVALPYLAAIFDYGYLALIFCLMILCSAVLLALADRKYPAPTFSAAGAVRPEALAEQAPDAQPLEETGPENLLAPEPQLEEITEPEEAMAAEETTEALEALEPEEEVTEAQEALEPEEEVTEAQEALETPEVAEPEETAETPEITETREATEPGEELTEAQEAIETPEVAEPEETAAAADATPEELVPSIGLEQLIDSGFTRKHRGDYLGAAVTFFRALQMQPEPKLAVLLATEVSDIYREAHQYWQAVEILNTLLESWRNELDPETVARLEIRTNQLHELLNKKRR